MFIFLALSCGYGNLLAEQAALVVRSPQWRRKLLTSPNPHTFPCEPCNVYRYLPFPSVCYMRVYGC
jgi:hypothetical protein